MERIHWLKLIKFQYSFADIIDYFRGNIRYKLYYSKFNHMLPSHIKEQIDFRINIMMDKECYNRGSCKVCGCSTTNLQMANKPCEGHCYPQIVNEEVWFDFKLGGQIKNDSYIWDNNRITNKFELSDKQFIIRIPCGQKQK